MAGTLTDRVVIITGGGRGIGRQHALLLASEGAKVVVNDLGGATDGSGSDVGAAQSVVDEIVAAGGEAVANTDGYWSVDELTEAMDRLPREVPVNSQMKKLAEAMGA